ncbi:MAG: hypothetical protein IJW37_08580 [Lachnospiraceae bacterium]|nr:hypothetical protein [Lachnospiraceae bacterium]
MKEKESIKQVYDEIHAPEALLRKVMEMNKKEFKFRNAVKYVAMAAVALAITLVASNGICYAATGETWIDKIVVFINGEETEQAITWHEEGDRVYGTMEVEMDTENPVTIEMITESGTPEEDAEIEIIVTDPK